MARDHKVEPIEEDVNDLITSDDEKTLARFAQKVAEEEVKIRKLWKKGQSPRVIRIQFPSYSEHDIIMICQAAYDIDKIDFKNLDGVLFQGYFEDIQELDNLYDKAGQLSDKLGIMNLKLSARERTVRYRELLSKLYNKQGENAGGSEDETISGQQELRIKAKLAQIKDPVERKKFIEKLESLQEDSIDTILEGDYTDIGTKEGV